MASISRQNNNKDLYYYCDYVRPADGPQRQGDDRYLPIGKSDDNPTFKTVPLRGKKRRRTASASPSPSQSPTKGGDDAIRDDDGFPETFIPADEARPIINESQKSAIGLGAVVLVRGIARSSPPRLSSTAVSATNTNQVLNVYVAEVVFVHVFDRVAPIGRRPSQTAHQNPRQDPHPKARGNRPSV
ncbi:hypothetical protein F5883DRAFT_646922 [Diaporthe sp. PMI_573]|nr:hypothetical protein F5883DRAFT_646922 [Diaporthaceae sp. PMI_573]